MTTATEKPPKVRLRPHDITKPGEAGIRRVLADWLTGEAAAIGFRRPAVGSELEATFFLKMRDCWDHHWAQAELTARSATDGSVVGGSIRAGQGFQGGGKLNGDVIAEIVLATAAVQREDAAVRRLTANYADDVTRRIGRQASADPDWWHEFLPLLLGLEPRSDGQGLRHAKLSSYSGHAGLTTWLTLAGGQFLSHRGGSEQHLGIPQRFDAEAKESRPDVRLQEEECRDRLARDLWTALTKIPGRKRAALVMVHEGGLQKKQVAELFGIHPGAITRDIDSAVELLKNQLRWNDPKTAPADLGDCLEALRTITGKQLLTDALIGLLRQGFAEVRN